MTNINKQKKFRLTKKIAKHGNQAIIVIPRMLEAMLVPGMIVEVSIKQLKGGNE